MHLPLQMQVAEAITEPLHSLLLQHDGHGVEAGFEFVEEIIFDEQKKYLDGPENKKAEREKNPVRPFAEQFFGDDPIPKQERQGGAECNKKVLVEADQENLDDAAVGVRFMPSEFCEQHQPEKRASDKQREEKENGKPGARTLPGKIFGRKLFGLPWIFTGRKR